MTVDLVLHIGSDKTGTSSIQMLLHRNRDLLAKAGVLYPRSPGRTRHTRMGLFIRPDAALVRTPAWQRESFDSPQAFRRAFRRRLDGEVRRAGLPRVLLSDEALFGASEEGLGALRRFTDRFAHTVRVVVYLRRQDERLVSRYQQEVKVGETARLVDRVRRDDLPRFYDYADRLDRWVRVMEPELVTVRPFEPSRFQDGSLHRDFLDAAGIALDLAVTQPVEPRNESLGADGVELLRLANLLRHERPELCAHLPTNRRLATLLGGLDTGPVLTLPDQELDAFMERWQPSNDRVSAQFLGRQHLFSAPRRTAGTTRQGLSAERLTELLTALEVPGPVHGPLQEVAAAEARLT